MQLNKNNPLKPKFGKIVIDKNKPVLWCYTDGSCNGNGKAINTGGWGYVIVDKENNKVIHKSSGRCKNTTNNKTELTAIILALKWIKSNTTPDTQVLLSSDSQYCIHGATVWYINWIKKDWNEVKNVELWKELIGLKISMPNVQYRWVRAHQTDNSFDTTWNNYADRLSVDGEEEKIIATKLSAKEFLLSMWLPEDSTEIQKNLWWQYHEEWAPKVVEIMELYKNSQR